MYPGAYVASTPDKPAVIMEDDSEVLTYAQLEERSTRLANAFTAAGLRPGDVVALLTENSPRVHEVYWACLRAGLYLTAVNWHLAKPEVEYILRDCGASALVVSAGLRPLVEGDFPALRTRVLIGGEPHSGYTDYEEFLAGASPEPAADQPRGGDMLYSSGTTGRPKGIKPVLPERQVHEPGDPYVAVFGPIYGIDANTVYLSPAPLYHAAPLRFSMVVTSLGGTVVVMPSFDAERAVRAIARYRVTHSQWVPTHFVRMLRLPVSVRGGYDLSSHKVAIHAAAPCPVEVKRQMIEWWGPILEEYYASTEGAGGTFIGSEDWLKHPGSVGKPMIGIPRICDDQGNVLPTGETGLIYFERDDLPFSYHNDPEKTRSAQHRDHPTWTTVGDVGRLDDEGYLYLSDRKAFTIISGGVNIYPQEIEDVLLQHPSVLDVAVIGVPDQEFGEAVLAVVQLVASASPTDETRTSLTEFARARLAGFKVPRQFEFTDALPRTPTGKLVKGKLREQYATAR
ncbi:acyl-CoA synthetase [Cryptosporangium aurantiacum]|uniref:Fatty-acyl-CoA synthase n=1 Tax=Cryptosporangium aurantiacum TaxID=134849 RepID=A0A1M7RJB4_9ACTN|nr:acyl-CoA synthetase [Cryptosporangium aurantiacum]SHN46249.1 fatty-acyl-CoA synthase [Cryptosporangium aurantiacum]